MTTLDIIVLTASNLIWGWVWFEFGKIIGRKEKKEENAK